jgi:hypothetical protein
VQPIANGFKLILKTQAFGYVSAPLPGQAQIELHVFSDPTGARWVDMSLDSLTLAPKGDKAARVPVQARAAASKGALASSAPRIR